MLSARFAKVSMFSRESCKYAKGWGRVWLGFYNSCDAGHNMLREPSQPSCMVDEASSQARVKIRDQGCSADLPSTRRCGLSQCLEANINSCVLIESTNALLNSKPSGRVGYPASATSVLLNSETVAVVFIRHPEELFSESTLPETATILFQIKPISSRPRQS